MTKASILILFGNDEFAMARRVKELESGFADVTAAGMNTTELDAATMNFNDLNTAVNAAPFLADHRLVVVRQPSARYSEAAERRKFEEFLLKAPDTTRLVICEELEPKGAEKSWLVTFAGKNREKVKAEACMLPRPGDMHAWIAKETKQQGGEIERKAAARLAELTGADTRQATQEILKLLAYVNWRRTITLEDVSQVSIDMADQSVFDFVDALAEGDAQKAQGTLHRLLEDEEAFGIWGMVIRQFRLLIQAREVLDGGGREGDVKRALGVHEYVAGKAARQARRFTMESLEAIYHRLLEIDAATKRGETTLEVALDLLVMELAQ